MADRGEGLLEWAVGLVAVLFAMLQGAILWIFNREVKHIDAIDAEAKKTRHDIRNELAAGDAENALEIDDVKERVTRLEERVPKHR